MSPHPRTAVCPGSYDPVTYGHLDVIRRTSAIFDHVIVAVVREPQHKHPMFTIEERMGFIRDAAADLPNVSVEPFSELVVEFARRRSATAIVKGLRAISDFEWEFQMNHLNHRLAPEVETIYLMAGSNFSFVSSSGVKEIAAFGGNVDELVPPGVAERFHRLASDRTGEPRPRP